jgi:hypothetical protein
MSEEQIIPKQAISMAHLLRQEALKDPSDIRRRSHDLNRAMTLENLEHGKVKIRSLNAQYHTYQVETAVRAVTDEYLFLINGLQITTCAVFRID